MHSLTFEQYIGIVLINVFVGYDYRERAAANVLCDSIWRASSSPVAITQLITQQLEQQGLFSRARDAKQSTEFSFTRFLVPHLMNYQGWALFMDCDMLCRDDIAKVWSLRDDRYAIMCTQHDHVPTETTKFMGEPQTTYPRKNWSSFILFNCAKCRVLTPEFVNNATGLELHRFLWTGDEFIGAVPHERWNYLLGVQSQDVLPVSEGGPSHVHWTLGGPWFPDYDKENLAIDAEWKTARRAAFELYRPDA